MRILLDILVIIKKVYHKFLYQPIIKLALQKCGKKVSIGKGCLLSLENICLGDNVSIGPKAIFLATKSKIIIKDNVMFGPRVTIIGGDHRTDILGRTMNSIKEEEKLPENDLDIFIKEDVWIGANVTILKGVTIGEGSIIAANSLVRKNVDSYCVYGGVPAKKIKDRFSKKDIEKHRKILKGRE